MNKKEKIESPAEELNDLAAEVIHSTRSNKIIIPIVLLGMVIVALIVFFSSVFPLLNTAPEIGQFVGETSGKAAGVAVGSVEGAISGISDGAEAGRAEGLSAKDTVVEISNTIKSNINGLGTLEVLIANFELTDSHEVGEKYGALYFVRGKAVYTVDLNKVTVTHKGGQITIVIPKPMVKVSSDPTQTERLSEWHKKYFNGSDSDGFKAYLASYTDNLSEDKISNYEDLMKIASESAVKQVTEIVNAVRGNNNEIAVTVSIQAE